MHMNSTFARPEESPSLPSTQAYMGHHLAVLLTVQRDPDDVIRGALLVPFIQMR